MAAELIPSTIAKYIAPYMMHHGLDRDTMLLQYIEVTVAFVFALAKGERYTSNENNVYFLVRTCLTGVQERIQLCQTHCGRPELLL